MAGVAVADLAPVDPDVDASFFERVGAAPVLLFVVVTAPLCVKALFKDRTRTAGSLPSYKSKTRLVIQEANQSVSDEIDNTNFTC